MSKRDFEAEVMQWRAERAERLRTSEKSWLYKPGK
jgi:hypothetical protein